MSRSSWQRAVYEYPILLIAGLFLAGIALVFVGARYFSEHEERRFVAYSEHLMRAFVAQRHNEFGNTARDYAVWDAMAEHQHGGEKDLLWLEKNVTASVYNDLGVDDALVLGANLRPLHVLRRGEKVALKRFSDWNSEFAATLASSMANDPARTTLSGVVRSAGVLKHVSAERIRSESGGAVSSRPGGWVVFAREMSPQWVVEISGLLSIKALTVSDSPPPGNGPRYALSGMDGQPVAWLSWQINQEHGQRGATLPLLLALLVLFAFVTLIAYAVLRMHRREIQAQTRMLRQSESLRRLARVSHDGGDERSCLAEIVHSVQQTLAVARVTFWRAQDGEFLCVAASGADIAEAATLDAREHGDYLDALVDERTLAASDIARDPRLASTLHSRQAPRVVAALDAAAMIGPRVVGLLRIEETGGSRTWQQDQISYAAGVADQIALAYESAERRNMEVALKRQQNYDVLTGLPNSIKAAKLLEQCMQQAGARVAYTLWQVSGLFHVNDEFGRAGGDATLREIARRLQETPGVLFAARLSGTRFALALLDRAAHEVPQEIEALYFRLQHPVDLAERSVALQLNCGVSLAPQDAQSSDELLRHAEFALESARASNSSSIEYYAPEENALARERHQLADALPAALDNNEFVVHFQPFVDLASATIIGAEALVRWQHPKRGLIPPDLFIPLAEETGQIQALGRFVLDKAISVQAGWMAQADREVVMAVNVSSLQLHDPEFIAFVEHLLQRYRVAPRLLDIEITESMSIELLDKTPDAIRRLHELGVCLSIDDFGTGYSSLSYLRHLPAKKLKIDRSFIERVPGDRHDTDLTRMIISLGTILDMTIVAEGIETVEQLQFLRAQGCHIGQGYLFSRPVCAADFERLLASGLPAING